MLKFSVDLMSIGRHNLSFPTWVFSHSSVAQLCPTLWNPMDCSTGKPGFPVHHQFLELPQTHVHWVGDAIQPSHLLLFLSPPAFPGGSEVKASAHNAGDVGSIPGLGRSPGERNCNPLQYSCLENPMDGGACRAIGHGVASQRETVGRFGRMTLKHVKYHVRNELPVQVRCTILDAWG